VNGSISELMDSRNRKFKIPNYCINNPHYEMKIINVDQSHKNKNLNIILHDVYENKKTNLNFDDNVKISDIKNKYFEVNSIDRIKFKLRLLFGGAELKDDNLLYQYNFQDGYIIQILKLNVD
jgi:Ubiquitin family